MNVAMKTKIVEIIDNKISAGELTEILLALKTEPVIFPTDTVYGIGVNAFSAAGVEKIYSLKQRDFRKPLVWLINSAENLNKYVDSVSSAARTLIEKFWPGALTLIFNASQEIKKSNPAINSLGLRIPNHVLLRDLIARAGVPLATTSVNITGEKSATDIAHMNSFIDKVPFIINGGQRGSTLESTVVDVRIEPPKILRQGSLSAKDINNALKI